jgi:maleate isomerase
MRGLVGAWLGSGHVTSQVTVGVLTPHAAPGPEVEFPEMAPGRVTTQVARVSVAGDGDTDRPPVTPTELRAAAAPDVLAKAAAGFTAGSIDVIGYASTTSAYAIGGVAESAMVDRLWQRLGLPVVATCLSATRALRDLDADRVALVHPPWFDDELDGLGASYFRSQGFTVVSYALADLPNDPSRIEPDAVVEWVSRHVGDAAEAVFIGGNGFRCAAAIEALEELLGRPVLESNQVLLWSALDEVEAPLEIQGYGRLFGLR